MKKLFFATGNQNKAKELGALTEEMGIEILTLLDFPEYIAPEETGSTFLENAFIKSRSAATYTGIPALADDSGLTVDVLNGAPGIYSARYSGENATAAENNKKLLLALKDVPEEKRQAQFRATLTLTIPQGKEFHTEGIIEGIILSEPQGTDGFGYDPIFFVPKYQRSMAELTMSEKNSISHRGQAFRNIAEILNILTSAEKTLDLT